MTLDEFVELLDKSNPRYRSLSNLFLLRPTEFRFARKRKDIVEVVEELQKIGFPPVVDTILKVVIGGISGHHRPIRAELYRYHKTVANVPDYPYCYAQDPADADAYTDEGMGYHFSTMKMGASVHPIVGEGYKPDRLDRDLFRFYKVEHRLY